jgi:HEAT repeat protein
VIYLAALVFSLVSGWQTGQTAASRFTLQADPARAVEQMRGISMQWQPAPRGDGRIDPQEQRRGEITSDLHRLGDEAIAALARTLGDADVQMRRNSALVLIDLGGGYSAEARPKSNTLTAMPALIRATQDHDSDVRAWAAHALAEIGPSAQPAVPALVKLLRDTEEGPRNTACIALGSIGPGAAEALPALREALDDTSADVRGFAQRAIRKIQTR